MPILGNYRLGLEVQPHIRALSALRGAEGDVLGVWFKGFQYNLLSHSIKVQESSSHSFSSQSKLTLRGSDALLQHQITGLPQ